MRIMDRTKFRWQYIESPYRPFLYGFNAYGAYRSYDSYKSFLPGERCLFNKKCLLNKNIDWQDFCKRYIFNEEIIYKYADKVDWNMISINQLLSITFIKKYSDKINWSGISINKKLDKQVSIVFCVEIERANIRLREILSKI